MSACKAFAIQNYTNIKQTQNSSYICTLSSHLYTTAAELLDQTVIQMPINWRNKLLYSSATWRFTVKCFQFEFDMDQSLRAEFICRTSTENIIPDRVTNRVQNRKYTINIPLKQNPHILFAFVNIYKRKFG